MGDNGRKIIYKEMEYKLYNGSGKLCCKSCGKQDKQLNTYDWLADIPGNTEENDLVEVQ